jgi:gentisate 1,2-dioxygenase
VLSGSGYTEIRASGEIEKPVEWQAGDLFCTPIHTRHRHVNCDHLCPARYLEITTIPLMKSLGDWHIEAGRNRRKEKRSITKSLHDAGRKLRRTNDE